jgi:uncharacterized membrane protein SpoIIM required for sporulation
MNKREFLKQRQPAWKRFEQMVDFFGARVVRGQEFGTPQRRSPKRRPARADRAADADEDEDATPDKGISEFSRLFREVSNDLATVRSRGWGESLDGYLNDMLARGYNCFYSAPPTGWQVVLKYLAVDFPKLFRANAGYFFTAAALFFIPLALSWIIVQRDPAVAERILPADSLDGMKEMYAKDEPKEKSQDGATAEKPEDEKGKISKDDAADDESPKKWDSGFGEQRTLMFGFYIRNNVGIAFRVFALGVLLGVGTVYVLLYNGIVIGAIAGYVCSQASAERFLTFVFSHGSFELTAIAVSGGAGLMLGNAIVHPGQRDRSESLADRALDAVQIALGAGAMLGIAALIEAYWSPAGLPAVVKLGGGCAMWLSVFLYLGMAGRGR